MKKLLYLFLLFIAVLYFGCGNSKTDLTKTDEGDIPQWYLNPPKDASYLYAVNTASSQDMQMAVDKATTAARAEIVRQAELKVNDLQKQFSEEIGQAENSTYLTQFTQATKTVTSTTLTGSLVKEKKIFKDGNTWRAYVLVEYPIGEANVALMNQIKKNNELYTRFRATQTFEELDKEVEKYEEWKSKN